MTNDTVTTLPSHDLETIYDALMPVWFDLYNDDERTAASYVAAVCDPCAVELEKRFHNVNDQLDLIEAGDGHVSWVHLDEVAEEKDGAGWMAVCNTYELLLGYYQTEAEAEATRARHLEDAGDR